MLDIKAIRSNPDIVDNSQRIRGKEPVAHNILQIDAELRKLIAELQTLQNQKNNLAKAIATKRVGVSDADIQQGQALRDQIVVLEAQISTIQANLDQILLATPNIPSDDAVIGRDENDNVEKRTNGTAPYFDFEPKEHHILGENLGYLDIPLAAKLSGTRFAVLTGPLARLERAIAQFMIDTHAEEFGYTEVFVPILVNECCMYGTGQLPKFAEDCFKTTEGQWLIPTAEVSLTNLVRDSIVPEDDLPLRVTALTPCFRSEAGSAGRDIKGMFRQRQFEKVELVSIVTKEQEDAEHERMTAAAENILKKLNLCYRVVQLCTGDMGFSARKTYDIEVWLPGQHCFREISSCSKCGDFQARRMNAKYRKKSDSSKTEFVRTLNGSGLAVGRTLIAIMENYQTRSGSIIVPDKLVPYMGGIQVIEKKQR
ncbi:MAG: serine--tRNA ligase [Holosporales bacterium]|jgi:seryl-tRNA synthetase|nr:serine--tRNA ligase [Holosporales bacterium]